MTSLLVSLGYKIKAKKLALLLPPSLPLFLETTLVFCSTYVALTTQDAKYNYMCFKFTQQPDTPFPVLKRIFLSPSCP